jgi:2-dehydro-3-deoxyphosphogluconate aldolase/(4S)-4-hydroxy-2-oxoglutarate aldolase
MDVLSEFAKIGVVPVVVLDDAKDAVPTARAMVEGGIPAMEITFRTAAAADSIRAVAQEVPEMLVGAGTVVNVEQAKLAVECGAKFIVAPGYDEETVAWCCENNIPVTPGCVTPTEIMMALKHGLKVVKFFPASVYGGLKALKALSGPFVGLKFIPTGGVNNDNLAEFLNTPFIQAVGGSWPVPRKAINEGKFDEIRELCAAAHKIVAENRG